MISLQENELLEILEEAEEDVRNNRVAPIDDTFRILHEILKGE